MRVRDFSSFFEVVCCSVVNFPSYGLLLVPVGVISDELLLQSEFLGFPDCSIPFIVMELINSLVGSHVQPKANFGKSHPTSSSFNHSSYLLFSLSRINFSASSFLFIMEKLIPSRMLF